MTFISGHTEAHEIILVLVFYHTLERCVFFVIVVFLFFLNRYFAFCIWWNFQNGNIIASLNFRFDMETNWSWSVFMHEFLFCTFQFISQKLIINFSFKCHWHFHQSTLFIICERLDSAIVLLLFVCMHACVVIINYVENDFNNRIFIW